MPRGRPRQDGGPEDVRSAAACDPLEFERDARRLGYQRIAGLDEAGRGPLAGPVVAAAVILPADTFIPGVTDSKQVPEKKRERLYERIIATALSYGIGIADERTIDDVNILQATIIAMERAVAALEPQPDYLLLDALRLPRVPLPQQPLIKGDCRSHSIAAASIIAKVTRDRMMQELHARFPQYGFDRHKGYGTADHLASIRRHGPCEAHRFSFAPVAALAREAGR